MSGFEHLDAHVVGFDAEEEPVGQAVLGDPAMDLQGHGLSFFFVVAAWHSLVCRRREPQPSGNRLGTSAFDTHPDDEGLAAAGTLFAIEAFLMDRAIRSVRPAQHSSGDVKGHRL